MFVCEPEQCVCILHEEEEKKKWIHLHTLAVEQACANFTTTPSPIPSIYYLADIHLIRLERVDDPSSLSSARWLSFVTIRQAHLVVDDIRLSKGNGVPAPVIRRFFEGPPSSCIWSA